MPVRERVQGSLSNAWVSKESLSGRRSEVGPILGTASSSVSGAPVSGNEGSAAAQDLMCAQYGPSVFSSSLGAKDQIVSYLPQRSLAFMHLP